MQQAKRNERATHKNMLQSNRQRGESLWSDLSNARDVTIPRKQIQWFTQSQTRFAKPPDCRKKLRQGSILRRHEVMEVVKSGRGFTIFDYNFSYMGHSQKGTYPKLLHLSALSLCKTTTSGRTTWKTFVSISNFALGFEVDFALHQILHFDFAFEFWFGI